MPDPRLAPPEMRPVLRSPHKLALRRSFLDEFEQFTSNTPPWRHHYGHGASGSFRARTLVNNLEQQLYVDPGFAGDSKSSLALNPFQLANGVLQIEGRKAPQDMRPALGGFEYVSGMLSTETYFEQKYGFFEARLRLPHGPGIWPAFWLLASRDHTPEGRPAWPPEIDIMEYTGKQRGIYHTSVHWDIMPDNKKSGRTVRVESPDEIFHNYGVLWTPEQTVFYLDRKAVSVIETKSNHNVPMYILLNLALGGRWPGPVSDAALPANFEIDWVAAYNISDEPCPEP